MESSYKDVRLGKFTGSEIYRLLAGGRRSMTEDELAAREKGDRRTTVDTYFGTGAETYILEKAAEIVTGQPKETPDTYATMWGNSNEKDAVQAFVEATGIEVEYLGGETPRFYPHGSFAGCSPDGLAGQTHILEVKCPFVSSNHVKYLLAAHKYKGKDGGEWLKENEAGYYAQIQMEMMCTGRGAAYFVSFDPRAIQAEGGKLTKIAIMEVKADHFFHGELKERIDAAVKLLREHIEVLL